MLGRDFVYAARTLRRSPGFTLTAVVTIALGIGAGTAIFSVVNAVLLRPLPYKDPSRLMLIWADLKSRDVRNFLFPPGDYEDVRKTATLFEDIAAVWTPRQVITGDNGEPEQIRTGGVTPNFFRVLGARIALGRDFADSDGVPQQPPAQTQPGSAPSSPQPRLPSVVILSHEFWQRRYGGDPRVLGRSIGLSSGSAQIVGVLAPGFELLFPSSANIERMPALWMAARLDFERSSRINVFLHLVGRMKPGVTRQRAQAEVDTIAADLRRRYAIKESSGLHFRLEPMHEDLVAEVSPALFALMGAVTFLLLIACANVANLSLVRASLRERELAVRAALGGNRWRLVRQMLAESLLLAGCGALAGLWLGQRGIDLLLFLKPARLPRIGSVDIDGAVLGFAVVAGLLSAATFGVLPALRASRLDVIEVLRASGRTAGLSAGRRLRSGVAIVEVALSFVLLIGCGLMLRSFVALQRTDPGFDAHGVLTFWISAPPGRSPARAAFAQQLRDRLRALPGVQSVSAARPLPLDGDQSFGRWVTEENAGDPSKFQQANFHTVLPGYFETLHARLVAGRTFTDADNASAQKLVIIDTRLAAKAFPGAPAVGKRLRIRLSADEPEVFEVIGVVGHQRHASLAADGREALFLTDGVRGHGVASRWIIRTQGDPARLAQAVRVEAARVSAAAVISEVQPMMALVDRARAQTRFTLVLIGVFAGIAVLVAAVGLYGVLATMVRQRTAEIGVRMALGAPPGTIFQLVVGQGLRLSVAGVALGLLAAFWLTRAMTSILIGVEPTDPATFASVALLFLAIASMACWLPARRAAALDPTTALREE